MYDVDMSARMDTIGGTAEATRDTSPHLISCVPMSRSISCCKSRCKQASLFPQSEQLNT